MATTKYVHPTPYRFYIQRYPDNDGTTYLLTDIEAKYNCRYMKFDGLSTTGAVKNVYQEDYAEMSGARIHIPAPKDITYSTYDCTLSLRFKGAQARANATNFARDHIGRKIEWRDTFRNVCATLLMTKAPTVQYERLIGDPYIVMDYTFTNTLGYIYASPQLK